MSLRRVISALRPEIRTYGDLTLAFVEHSHVLNALSDFHFDGIVVKDPGLISEIRRSDQLYLKPILWEEGAYASTDGTFDKDQPTRITYKIQKINEAAEQFVGLPLPGNGNDRLVAKLLRLLISRSTSLSPRATRDRHIGYALDMLENLSVEQDPLQLIKFLNHYTDKGYFRRKLIDRVNLCYECESGYLNFSECCSSCESIDLKSEQLIHHFRCAYIGPESDYKRGEILECPKCNHVLKHIGIDYDKPSEIHTCMDCNHTSQETAMKAKCVDCGRDNALDKLSTHAIYEYRVTESGTQFSKSTENQMQPHLMMDASDSDAYVPLAVYQILKSHESRKQDLYEYGLSELRISVSEQILGSLNSGLRKGLLTELAGIVKPYLKNQDILSINADFQIIILLLNYSGEAQQQLRDLLDYNLDKMLRDNQWTRDKAVEIHTSNIES